MQHNPKRRWYDVPAARDGRAVLLPHGAFEDPTTPAAVLPRESIELLTIAFASADAACSSVLTRRSERMTGLRRQDRRRSYRCRSGRRRSGRRRAE